MLGSFFQNRAAGYLSAVLGIAVVTAIYAPFRGRLHDATVALTLVLVVLFIATLWGRGPGIVASVLGMFSYNFFLLPPTYSIYSFTIADPQNWIALAAFIITASTVGHLSVTAKRRAAEAEASRSRARLASVYNRSLLEASLDPLVTVGADGKINDANSAAETVTGHSRAELIGADFSEYFTEREKARAGYQQVLREGFVRDYALELRHRDGHVTSVLYNASLYRDDDGNVIGVVAAARPVSTYAEKPLGALSDPRVVKGLNRFVSFTSLFSVAVGLLGLVGWAFHFAILKSVIPGRIVITPNTDVCFVLIGFSLWLLRKKVNQTYLRSEKLCGQIMAAITALVGLLSLTEHLVGWDLGIDQFLFTETPADAMASVRPGLMDPITALDFLLLGLALLLLDWAISWRSRRYWPARFFAFLAGIIAVVGLLDFILGSRISYTHIALQSAVTLLLLSFGLLCARTEQGLGALLASSTVGGALTRRLLPAAVSIPIVIGVVGWWAFFAGLYTEWSGVSLMVVMSISLLAGFTIWNGYRVDRSDVERRRAEAIIHRRGEELREAQRLAQVGSWWWAPKSDSGAWSEQLCRIAGRDPKLPPPSYKEHCRFYTSESSARLDAAVQKAIQTGTPYELDLEMVRTDGAIRSVTSRGEVERDADGQVVLVRGTVQDVTEHKRAEEEIRTLNAELEQRVNARTAELQDANRLKDELIVRERAASAELAQAREREVEIGFRIQQTLLLDQPPMDIPGLRMAALTIPSQRIDGDFYVFFKHPDQRLDVIVGDVMGKGVPAALLGAATKSHFIKALGHLMALAKNGKLPEPKEIVTLAHAEVARHLINLENFVTLCYARLDLNKRKLDLVDCGHTGLIHLHGKTGQCEMVHGDNLPLGIREGEIYSQISVPFESGDLLLFYSDGVTEARNFAGELFGADRLLNCVTTNSKLEPEALVEAIRNATVAFSESARLTDDLTCVAIRIKEPQLALARAEIEIRSDLKELSRARAFVRTFCRHLPSPLNEDSVAKLELAVNEAASNIMKHAYRGRADQWIHLEAEAFPSQVSVRLHHLGDPFDPSAFSPPALDGSQESGFGIYLITQSVDDVRYYRDERGRNCIALVKVHTS